MGDSMDAAVDLYASGARLVEAAASCGVSKSSLYRELQRRCIMSHNPIDRRSPWQERFWRRVDKSGSCWLWTGSRHSRGYGTFNTPEGRRGAHRIAYTLLVGEIPDGLHLDHLCRTPACVNPDHLEPVTPAENVRRSRGCRLTAHQVETVRTSPKSTYVLAAEFGVSQTAIHDIRSGRTWR